MRRAPFQILVLPYRRHAGGVEYAVLRRADGPIWQFIAGGGEDDEKPAQAAIREAGEEAGVPMDVKWTPLDSLATVPRSAFPGGAHWPDHVYVVPEHCFAVDVTGHNLTLSAEHSSFDWLGYESAWQRLTWQSNQTALWELRERLRRSGEPA